MAIHRSIAQDDWNRLHQRLTAIENGLSNVLRRLDTIDGDIEAIETRLDDDLNSWGGIHTDIDILTTRLDDIHTTVDAITQAD